MTKVWGPIAWYMMHTLASRVNPQFYQNNRETFVNIIKNICAGLPCPICKAHAVKYVRNLSIRHVPTKEHFKQYLKAFHNNVNKLTNKPIVEDISKYDHFNIFLVFRSFLNLFTYRRYSHQFIESMRRRKVSDEIRKLIYGNQKMFQ